eukprot:5622443-Pyramimonas_sp.AAC.1
MAERRADTWMNSTMRARSSGESLQLLVGPLPPLGPLSPAAEEDGPPCPGAGASASPMSAA